MANAALGGFLTTPIISVAFSLATEITYPIQPTLSNGALMFCGSLFTALLSVIGNYLVELNANYIFIGFSCLSFVTGIASCFIVQENKKSKA
jgi:hypothetical protein